MKIIKDINRNLDNIKSCIAAGEPIILPTDTNYCLGVHPGSKAGIAKLYELKRRAGQKPLTLAILHPGDWNKHGKAPNAALMELLTSRFWPGPFNIIVKRSNAELAPMVQGGPTISLTCIGNPTLRKVMKLTQGEIAITSANISGAMADTGVVTLHTAARQMSAVRYLVASEQPAAASRSSTIVFPEQDGIRIVREGDITKARLKEVLNQEGYDVK